MKPRIFFILTVSIILSCGISSAGEYINFIGMKFRDIPAGSFYMGACNSLLTF